MAPSTYDGDRYAWCRECGAFADNWNDKGWIWQQKEGDK